MPPTGSRAPAEAASTVQVGRYELVKPLARGGMAELHLARVTGPHDFQKIVVVKRILAHWADEPEFVEMFLNEARLAATLDHPNVVHIHDFDQDDQGPWFAMEYIHGEDLGRLIRVGRQRDKPLPLRHVLTVGIGAAAGLHHAHERKGFDGKPLGIIHRDISPSNILVTYDGGVKLVDFGIAKAAISRHATRPSIRKGKIAYMSPEQCSSAPLDRRSDLFALGIVLYELATGVRVFEGTNEFAIMNRIINHDVVPPSEHYDKLPAGFDKLILRALHRDPDTRYVSARQFQLELEQLAEAEGLTPSAAALADAVEDLLGPKPYPWEVPTPRPFRPGGGNTERIDVGGQDEVPTYAASVSAQTSSASTAAPRPWSKRALWVPLVVVLLLGMGWGGWKLSRSAPTQVVPAPERAPVEAASSSPAPQFEHQANPSPRVAPPPEVPDKTSPDTPAEATPDTAATDSEPPPVAEVTSSPPRPRTKARRRKPQPKPSATPSSHESKPARTFNPDGPAPRRREDPR